MIGARRWYGIARADARPWATTYRDAMAACEVRALTLDEKLACVAEALEHASAYPTVNEVAGRSILSARQIGSIVRRHGAELASLLGVASVDYRASEYQASGRGAFGRLGGGAPGRYHEARISITR